MNKNRVLGASLIAGIALSAGIASAQFGGFFPHHGGQGGQGGFPGAPMNYECMNELALQSKPITAIIGQPETKEFVIPNSFDQNSQMDEFQIQVTSGKVHVQSVIMVLDDAGHRAKIEGLVGFYGGGMPNDPVVMKRSASLKGFPKDFKKILVTARGTPGSNNNSYTATATIETQGLYCLPPK